MEAKNTIYLETKGELKYQMNIKNGIAIEKIMIFQKQADLIEELEKMKENFNNEEVYFKWIKENIKIACFCSIEVVKNENT